MHITKALVFAASLAGFVSAAAIAEAESMFPSNYQNSLLHHQQKNTNHHESDLADRYAVRSVRMVDGFKPTLEKRACKSNGCTCYKGTKQGQYCYNDFKPETGTYYVQKAGSGHKANDRYECNPSAGCCDYGPSSVCN